MQLVHPGHGDAAEIIRLARFRARVSQPFTITRTLPMSQPHCHQLLLVVVDPGAKLQGATLAALLRVRRPDPSERILRRLDHPRVLGQQAEVVLRGGEVEGHLKLRRVFGRLVKQLGGGA
jgi:hypothetical protein